MKKTEIALLLDDKFEYFDVTKGSIHVNADDCSTIKIHKDGDYVGSLSKSSSGWKFNPASIGSWGKTFSLNIEGISELTKMMKYAEEKSN